MITMNGTNYRLCLLDTNAVSEMVKRPTTLGHVFKWSMREQPYYIACYSLFTVLELRRSPDLWERFLDQFGPLPSMLIKSHEQLLEDEALHYPEPSGIDPTMLGFSGELGSDGNRLAKVLPLAFQDESLREKERYWNEGQDEIVEGIASLVENFPPEGSSYTNAEVRLFVEIAGFSQVVMRAHDFAAALVKNEEAVDIDAFPSLKASLYTVFHKFYADRTRKPTRSDAFDIIISAATPYVEAVITENHQAEVLRKTKRRDPFIEDLSIFTLRDFRDAPP